MDVKNHAARRKNRAAEKRKKAIFLPPFMEKVGRKMLTAGQSVLRLSCCFSLKKHQLFIILRGIAGIWFSDQQFNGSERVAW